MTACLQELKKAPILFYTGNEANIELFFNTSGFQSYTLAKRYGALVVYAEHRYFGESIPFGWSSETAN